MPTSTDIETILVTAKGEHIRPKTVGQQNYVDTIRHNVITFGIGPAGTGKTYLAVVMAVYYLRIKDVKKIILTRPAVEADEHLGFLPGDIREKVDPYLRPLYDALQDTLGFDMYQKFV
ncbi:MAG: PhoH family protein, partial [Selenomonadaceae bacterium]|nr:PhoH family protein [Selenomonadaceae bacterium]